MYYTDSEKPNLVFRELEVGQYRYRIRLVEEDGENYRWCEAILPRNVWNRGAIISALIRLRYSSDEVEAIMNNVLNDPLDESRMAEYKALQEWRMKAKEYALELLAWADEHGIGDLETQVENEDENYDVVGVASRPDGIMQLAQALSLAKAQARDLPDEQAIDVPALFPAWADMIGQQVEAGERLYYDNRLWKVIQTHTIQSDWTPDIVPALFTEIVVQQEGEPELGTLDNPIPYNGNMVLEQGKYYTQGGVVYRCIRDSVNPVYNDLSALVGLYVQVVE